jgi:hypothetical protein
VYQAGAGGDSEFPPDRDAVCGSVVPLRPAMISHRSHIG